MVLVGCGLTTVEVWGWVGLPVLSTLPNGALTRETDPRCGLPGDGGRRDGQGRPRDLELQLSWPGIFRRNSTASQLDGHRE